MRLTVVPREVVRRFGKSGGWEEVVQGGVRAMEIVVMEEEGKELGAVVVGVIGTGISPFTGDGLDEAFGLAIGLRVIGTGEEVMQAKIFAGGGEEF